MNLAPCGLDCDACPQKPAECDGCHADSDHLWCADCGIRVCCKQRKGLSNCAQCEEFPCARIVAFGSDQWAHHRAAVGRLHELAAGKGKP